MANTFRLKIITPSSVKFDEEVLSILTNTSEGKVEILANHASIVINTVQAITLVTKADGEKVELFTARGLIGFKDNELDFCCGSCETKDEIDVERAKAAKERAEKRLKEDQYDKERATAALRRALIRLQLKNK